MIYVQFQDLLKAIDERTLNDVIEVNDLLLDDAEEASIEEMKGYLNTRYDVETIFTTDSHPLVVKYLVDMMLYDLHARVSPDHIPELRKERYQFAINWLEKIADGFTSPVGLAVKAEDEKIPLRYGSSTAKQNNFY